MTPTASLSILVAIATALPAQGPGFDVDRIEVGAGRLYPYEIAKVDPFGQPTATILEIRNLHTLVQNATPTNLVRPPATMRTAAVLPSGAPGNHFIHVRFNARPRIGTLLSTQPGAAASSYLTGALQVTAIDPATGARTAVRGRAFVGGHAVFDDPTTPTPDPTLVVAVRASDRGTVIVDPRATGFPTGFAGAAELVSPRSFVFVADTDDDLTTLETFPAGVSLRIEASDAVLSAAGAPLSTAVCTATSVGPLSSGPRLASSTPANGAFDVDVTTDVVLEYDQPAQPIDVGDLTGALVPTPGRVTLAVAERRTGGEFPVLVRAEPISHGDLCRFRVQPIHPLAGQSRVSVTTLVRSLTGVMATAEQTTFTTATGPGLVNAPVAPEAIYIGLSGARVGIEVLDLNGFGQGTGDPLSSRFVLNPNLGAPGVIPPLAPGTSLLDGGGSGFLTKTIDDVADTRLLREPLTAGIREIQLGQPLDLVYNSSNINRTASASNQVSPATGLPVAGNTIGVAPHPNPPRILFPATNPQRAIYSEEPTVTSSTGVPGRVTTTSPPAFASPNNLLVAGNPFIGTGILGGNFDGTFVGPQPPPGSPPPPLAFTPFTARQQIGQFLYALDADADRVLVLNSNRFTILDQIEVADPVDLAVSPDLRRLAISSDRDGVLIADIDPTSASFHQVIQQIAVAAGPTELAWQPDGEALFVCHDRGGLTILDPNATILQRLPPDAVRPIGVAVTARQTGIGTGSGTYFAHILNADGSVSLYESGPIGSAGSLVGTVSGTFAAATAIQPDLSGLTPACWVTHRDTSGLGQVSRIEGLTVTKRIGGLSFTTPAGDLLSGNQPVDLAFDDNANNGGYPDRSLPGLPGFAAAHSGKGQVKIDLTGTALPAHAPQLLFVALADVGKVDVFDLATGTKLAVIDAPGVACLAHYWRQ